MKRKKNFLCESIYTVVFVLFLCWHIPAFSVEFNTIPTVVGNPNPGVPLAAVVSFQSNVPVKTEISFSDRLQSQTLNYGSHWDSEKGLPVVGLKPSTTYDIIVKIIDIHSGQTASSKKLTYRTPELQTVPLEFPKIEISESIKSKLKKGITLYLTDD